MEDITSHSSETPLAPLVLVDRPTVGVGLEAEGFVLDKVSGRPVVRIEGQNTAARLFAELTERYRSEAKQVTAEEASFHVEIQSGIHPDWPQAAREIMTIQDAINTILAEHDAELVFQSVPKHDFEFVPSPNPRAAELLADPSWAQLAKYTAIASIQPNDSRLFADCKNDKARWRRSWQIMNMTTPDIVARMREHDTRTWNHEGKTRLQILRELIPGKAKWEAFQAFGYTNPEHVLYPDYFETVEDFKNWILGHGKKRPGDSVESVSDKDVHGGVYKMKRLGKLWVAENRIMGSHGSTSEAMLQHLKPVTDHHEDLLKEFGI